MRLAAAALLLVLASGLAAPPSLEQPDRQRRAAVGAKATTVARGVPYPSNIAFDPAGGIWLTSAGYQEAGSDGVWRVRRAGAAPRHVIRGLSSALGLTWYRGELYVAHVVPRGGGVAVRGRVTAYGAWDGRRFARRRTVLDRIPVGQHRINTIVPGPEGRLYLGVGSVRNASQGPSPLSAAVISFRRSGRGVRVEARGLRNPYGLAFIPGTSTALVSDNGRDDLGPTRPPDELNLFTAGRSRPPHFGFPGCWGQGGPRCRGFINALVRLAPHAAAGGVAVSRRFGRFGRTAFVAENGSTIRRSPTGDRITRVRLHRVRGRWIATRHRFASGFRRHDPLGTAIGPDGALYVTMHRSGRVLRFAPPPLR